jgi:hypothetical protein
MEREERFFTVAEANALLPRLEEILERLLVLYREISRLFSDLNARGLAVREEEASPDDTQEIREQRARLRHLALELEEGISEVTGMGCFLKDIETGLVDFLSRRGGRSVFLCWRRGEPDVAWWHHLGAGYQGRRPIRSADEFEGSYLH